MTAVPTPPNTSTNVPKASAPARRIGMPSAPSEVENSLSGSGLGAVPSTLHACQPLRLDAVAQVDDAVVEAALVQQLQADAGALGQRGLAAAHENGREQQLDPVDEAGGQRLRGELGAADHAVALGLERADS